MTNQAPSWFDKDFYLESKLAQLQAAGETQYVYPVDVENAIVAAGFTVYDHFDAYSIDEGTNPNEWFNTTEYLQAKAAASGLTVPALVAAIKAAGMTSAYEHFALWGWKEGINPSNAFDLSDYLDAKAADANMTVAALTAALETAGLDPIAHYQLYGQYEEFNAGDWIAPVLPLEQVLTGTINVNGLLDTLAAAEEAEADALAEAAQFAADNAVALGYDIDASGDGDGEVTADDVEAFLEDYPNQGDPAGDLTTAEDAVTDAENDLAVDRALTIDGTFFENADLNADYDGKSASDARLTALLADAQAIFDADADGNIAAAQEAIDDAEALVADDVETNGSNVELLEALRDAIVAENDAGAAYDDAVGGITLGAVLTLIIAALASDDEAAVAEAIADIVAAGPADVGTDIDAVDALIVAREALLADVATAEAAYEALDEVLDLAAAQALVDAREDLIAALADAETLLAGITPVAAAHAAAVEVTTAAEEELADWNVVDATDVATIDADDDAEENDLFVFVGESAEIDNFGADGVDLISFGTGYSLVTLTPEEEDATHIEGDINALEIFVEDDGADLLLHVETNAFDGNTTTNGDMVTITLIGLSGGVVSINNAGFLTVDIA